jgi:predicted small secreted protein
MTEVKNILISMKDGGFQRIKKDANIQYEIMADQC